jgi:hypothetical protein
VTYASGLLANNSARGYIGALRGRYDSLVKLVFVSIALVVVLAVIDRLLPRLRDRLAPLLKPAAVAGTIAIVLGVLYAYFVRPRPLSELPVQAAGEPMTKALQRAINAWHRTQTMHWLGDWFGPLTLAVAFVGVILMMWWALRGNTTALVIILLVMPLTFTFIWRPSITADHPWAMRRFLPLTIPLIAMGLAVVGRTLWKATREIQDAKWRAVAVGGIAVLGAVVVAPSAIAAEPMLEARNQHGALAAIDTICRTTGPDGAVFIYGTDYVDLEWLQTVRGFCGVPVAKPYGDKAVDVPALAAAAEEAGRTLFILTATPEAVRAIPGIDVTERSHVVVDDRYAPEQRFGGRSEKLEAPRPREAWLFEVQSLPAAVPPSG